MSDPRPTEIHLGRRSLLFAAAGLGLAACTGDPRPVTSTATTTLGPSGTTAGTPSTTSTTSATTPTTAPTTTPVAPSTTTTAAATPLPASAVWPVPPGDVEPAAKQPGARLVESLTAWAPGQSGAGPAGDRVTATGIPADRAAALTAAAAPFLRAGDEATSRVISAQYGGLTADLASILVTYEQWSRTAQGQVVRGGSAADVRLSRQSGGWVVTELRPADPGPALANPSALVTEVLANSRIRLPPSAAADLAAGNLMPKPMRALLTLANTYDIDVSIVHSAHPTNVFETNRLSDHTRKRAFDVWAVNGQPVLGASTSASLVDGFMRATVAAGAYNVGGPRQLSGAAYFSDRTHSDHVHVGFNADT
ncbi:MAG: hypothetical protein ABIW80_15970 [Lapillicoccus sp.]